MENTAGQGNAVFGRGIQGTIVIQFNGQFIATLVKNNGLCKVETKSLIGAPPITGFSIMLFITSCHKNLTGVWLKNA
ncbi:hypothetical protein JCM39194_15860 [Desulfotomaculum varum]